MFCYRVHLFGLLYNSSLYEYIAKNYKVIEMFPYLQAYHISQETSGSGTKAFSTHGTAGSTGISIIVLVPLVLKPYGGTCIAQRF